MSAATIPAIVLAGERPGGNALARTHGLSSSVLVDVAGRACITRVIDALRGSRMINGGMIVGPEMHVKDAEAVIQALLNRGDYSWLAPASGPSASALAACAALNTYPCLLTAADHALLTPAIIDEFCANALASDADAVVGLVPYARVHAAFPHSRRTLLQFSDGTWCGSNLFLLRRAAATRILEFWRALESERKRPWRIAARIGAATLLRYLSRRLSSSEVAGALSERAGARIEFINVDHARAAVDVDSSADLALAVELLHGG